MRSAESHRIAFTVHYDGSAFFGWQLQREHRSVQGELERVLSRLFDRPSRVVGSGRTDRGVHATGQVAAVDAPIRWSAPELGRAMNSLLSPEVWIAHAAVVAPDFHPRYDALARSYVYRLGLAADSASPFLARWCWPLGRAISREPMEEGILALGGEHSFSAFAKAGQEERGDRCTVHDVRWREWEVGLEFQITANRFLHHMVRYLVGTLVEIGLGRRPVDDVRLLLQGEPGLGTSPPAPARGLFLTGLRYAVGAYGGTAAGGGAPAGAPLPPRSRNDLSDEFWRR